MRSWANVIIMVVTAILSGVITAAIQWFMSKEKGGSPKRIISITIIVAIVCTSIVGVVLPHINPSSDTISAGGPAITASDSPHNRVVSDEEKSSQEDSSQSSAQNTVLEFSGAVQSRTHNAGPGHKTSASVLLKRIDFAENYTIVVVEVENSGDSDLTINTSEIQGSTALIVDGKSYPYVKHNGSTIVSGTIETITFYFERCTYHTGDSIALNFHLGLALQYNLKNLQQNIK